MWETPKKTLGLLENLHKFHGQSRLQKRAGPRQGCTFSGGNAIINQSAMLFQERRRTHGQEAPGGADRVHVQYSDGPVPRGDVNPLAHKMLAEFGTLSMLLSADPADISRRCGVKESTAVLLVLQSALAHRLQQEKWRDKPVLDSVSRAGAFAVDLLSHYHYERFYVVCLDNRKQLIHTCMISEGTIDESVVHPRLVVEAALRYQASSVILMHNHPGGTLMPSFSGSFRKTCPSFP